MSNFVVAICALLASYLTLLLLLLLLLLFVLLLLPLSLWIRGLRRPSSTKLRRCSSAG
eukprot:COSAG02_NODE_21138_length_800_cov_1.263909_2_plen_58_part_00